MCDDRKNSKCPWASIMSPTQENIHRMASIIFMVLCSLKRKGDFQKKARQKVGRRNRTPPGMQPLEGVII
jgi:hypothetical protein